MSPKPADLAARVREMNAARSSYHTIDFGDGIVLNGEYDMRRYLRHYPIPEDLSGWTALDVGAATGFFSLEMERRGAEVTAIDIWDPEPYRALLDEAGSKVRYIQKSVFDLDASFGSFDLVLCGSLLLHLSDIFTAVRKLREACRRLAVVATAIGEHPGCADRPHCEFIGAYHPEDGAHLGTEAFQFGGYWTVWLPNLAALRAMIFAAGFSDIHSEERFELLSEPGRGEFKVPHAVVAATVQQMAAPIAYGE